MSGAAAILIVRRERSTGPIYLGFTFGYGWQLLRPTMFERGFGLRTCLNIVFEGDTGAGDLDPARLRSVDAKRVGANLLRSRHQVSGVAALEELGIDIRRDLLNGVTGVPADADAWGRRVTGRDSLQFARRSLANLADICDQILDAYDATSYQARFSFIDDFKAVTDPVTRTFLQEEVLASLQAKDTSSLDLAPPELVEWERVGGFQYHTERLGKPTTRVELRLSDYLATLENKGILGDVTIDRLRTSVVWAVDGDGTDIRKWSVWNCLFGQIEMNGETYVLDDGDFYLVSHDYVAALNADITDLAECDKTLPKWHGTDHEDKYNIAAASSSETLLLLDRKTVRIGSHTNQVEVCDLLSDDGYLIHVKRKRDGSASLSHLFAQGLNSADLIVTSPEFRELALKVIEKAEAARAKATGDEAFVGRFRVFEPDRIAARDYEVVYAIHADWADKGFESLPFFSKITLRNAADDLRRLGFRVSVKRIEPE